MLKKGADFNSRGSVTVWLEPSWWTTYPLKLIYSWTNISPSAHRPLVWPLNLMVLTSCLSWLSCLPINMQMSGQSTRRWPLSRNVKIFYAPDQTYDPFYKRLMRNRNMLGFVIYVCHSAGICPSHRLLLTSRVSWESYFVQAFYFFHEVVGGLTYSCRRNLTKDRMALKPITLIHA